MHALSIAVRHLEMKLMVALQRYNYNALSVIVTLSPMRDLFQVRDVFGCMQQNYQHE